MRLRRLELVVLGLTLAFACFIGGYFTGRSVSAVSVVPFASIETKAPEDSGADVPSASGAGESSDVVNTSPPGGSTVQEAPGSPRDSDGRININQASRSELMDLPGIGSVLSERIVDYRRLNGPFTTIDDLRNVSGIGEKRFETIRDRVTVGN